MDEEVLHIVKLKGPLQPIVVTRDLKINTIFSAAALSTLVGKKRIMITSVKKGGSPFYYAEGQERKLESLSQYLNEKDKETFELLKQEKVLKDSEQTPLTRVGLRTIKDYAKPLNVTYNGQKQLFWKYYLVEEAEASDLIKGMLGVNEQEKVEQQRRIEQEKQKKAEQDKKIQQERIEQEKQKIQKQKKAQEEARAQETLKVVPEQPKVAIQQKTIEDKKPEIKKKKKIEEIRITEQQTIPEIEEKKIQEIKVEERKQVVEEKQEIKKERVKDKFLEVVEQYLKKKNIEIKECTIIKKNSEIELIVRVPSALGTSQYYCRAKNKKKINDGDLSTAYIKGQKRQMPTLFLAIGELDDEAARMLENEFKDQLTFQKI